LFIEFRGHVTGRFCTVPPSFHSAFLSGIPHAILSLPQFAALVTITRFIECTFSPQLRTWLIFFSLSSPTRLFDLPIGRWLLSHPQVEVTSLFASPPLPLLLSPSLTVATFARSSPPPPAFLHLPWGGLFDPFTFEEHGPFLTQPFSPQTGPEHYSQRVSFLILFPLCWNIRFFPPNEFVCSCFIPHFDSPSPPVLVDEVVRFPLTESYVLDSLGRVPPCFFASHGFISLTHASQSFSVLP